MKRIVIPIFAAATATAALPAVAQAAQWSRIDQRQARIEQRIDQGVRSGQLTPREAQHMRRRMAELNRLEDHYLRSGHGLDRQERADLERRYDRLSVELRLNKHDFQNRRY